MCAIVMSCSVFYSVFITHFNGICLGKRTIVKSMCVCVCDRVWPIVCALCREKKKKCLSILSMTLDWMRNDMSRKGVIVHILEMDE